MDPLCGWCYGFSPVMDQVAAAYPELPVRVLPGGMITGSRIAPISNMAGYILEAYRRVESYSGVRFGEAYLELLRQGTELSNSEPSCRAIHVFGEAKPEHALRYTHALQQRIFLDGVSWNNVSMMAEVAAIFGLDKSEFISAMNSEEARYGTLQGFQWCSAAGISGFPCLIMQRGQEYYMIAGGYRNFEDVAKVLEKLTGAGKSRT